jgi:hypothetical protein
VITWSLSTNISGDSDVVAAGVLVDAWNLGSNLTTPTTINGVNFVASPELDPATDGTFTLFAPDGILSGGGFNSGNAPFANLSAPYRKLLSSAQGANPDLFLTISGLSPGHGYLFEWWSSESNSTFNLSTTASAGTSVTLQANPNSAVGGVGQFATGTFTADGTGTQTIDFSSAEVLVNGFQLRDTGSASTPEPGSLALLTLGALMLAGCRRRLTTSGLGMLLRVKGR